MTPIEFSQLVGDLTTPFIVMMVGLIIALWIKDLAVKIAKGLSFKMFGPFKEGDEAYIDGHKAIIVKIGLTMTVFGIQVDDKYLWRFVPNEKINNLKLSKIIKQ